MGDADERGKWVTKVKHGGGELLPTWRNVPPKLDLY